MSERTSLFQTPIECAKIMEIVPQRFPFLYVDRVLELEPGVSAVGLKNVTINEDYFPGHFVHEPVIPGTIFIEIAAQITGIINAAATGIPGSRGIIVKMEDVKARAKVVPGDQLIAKVRILETNGNEQLVEFTHEVDGKGVVSEGRITLRKK